MTGPAVRTLGESPRLECGADELDADPVSEPGHGHERGRQGRDQPRLCRALLACEARADQAEGERQRLWLTFSALAQWRDSGRVASA